MKKLVIILALLMVLGVGSAFAQTEIIMLTEDFPPLNYVEKQAPIGPSVEIVQAIKTKLGLKTKVKVLPWKRAYNKALNEKDTCVFSTTRTEKREKIFKWVGPLAEKRYVFYAAKSSHLKVASLEDAKKYKIGVQMGGVSEEFLKSKGFSKLDTAATPEKSMKKLNVGRVDLWYTSTTTPIALAKKTGIDLADFEEVFVVKKSLLYIAFNVGTSDEVIKQWQDAYDELSKSGTIKAIFDKYKLGALVPSSK